QQPVVGHNDVTRTGRVAVGVIGVRFGTGLDQLTPRIVGIVGRNAVVRLRQQLPGLVIRVGIGRQHVAAAVFLDDRGQLIAIIPVLGRPLQLCAGQVAVTRLGHHIAVLVVSEVYPHLAVGVLVGFGDDLVAVIDDRCQAALRILDARNIAVVVIIVGQR